MNRLTFSCYRKQFFVDLVYCWGCAVTKTVQVKFYCRLENNVTHCWEGKRIGSDKKIDYLFPPLFYQPPGNSIGNVFGPKIRDHARL